MPGAYAWSKCQLDVLLEDSLQDENLTTPWLHVNPDTAGTLVWTIVNQRACPWPMEDYGQFYQNSVYLVLVIQRIPQTLLRHLHIWVGKYASESDYTSAFIRAREVTELLKSEVTVHRQVQGRESSLFLSVFNPTVYWQGSPQRGYRHCTLKGLPYRARMIQLYKPNDHSDNVVGKEVPCNVKELDPAYTYILDTGSSMFMWQGDLTATEDDMCSIRFLESLRASRGGGVKVEVLNEEQLEGHAFFNYLSHDGYKRSNDYVDEDASSTLHRNSMLGGNSVKQRHSQPQFISLYYDPKTANRKKRKASPLAIFSGEFRIQKHGQISKKDLLDGDVFLYDEGDRVWLWISKKALEAEKELALQIGHEYLRHCNHPLVPLTVVQEEYPDDEFSQRLHPSSQNGRHTHNGIRFEED